MEDPDHMLLLCVPGKGYSSSEIEVEFDCNYNMKKHPLYLKNADDVWQNKLKNCSNLFNASKFRFNSVEISKKENSSLPSLKLFVGLTCYKDFIGTNCSPYAEKLCEDGRKDLNNSQLYLADPIGVGGILLTKDDDAIFIRRSKSCAEMPLLIDRPGGHPEPDAVFPNTEFNMSNEENFKIAKEIFDSILKEIRDEVNIPIDCLSQPILLGIDFNPTTWKRPSLEFFVRCFLSTREVKELYQMQTQVEFEESTELITIPVEKLLTDCLKEMKLFEEFTHPAKSAIYFLKVFLSEENSKERN